ncbi:cyclic dehypoxanthinyl futalosine synthase [Desulfobaculum bizertense]|uniref:Cyclic dehypoxanthine futalosine synthase n=1 Tax=Desulfobaculum bizertense DSM 18034 TaxID=1121442 RepID=A0A1T4VPZ3_9BACT|nr:cyclic dehypoxanthinyl futalosine synthase [Desulfobaculum bizertense]UIJ38147.1 dehypoxanthine futalosine cyclase [Desulfobaculum bizertense]SKA66571.1 de-hypoxanthine futalosine cyclase [Desulfobaculum bizertense DSM 18034]
MSERLTPEAALKLLTEESVFSLGRMAHARRMELHPDRRVTYIVDRNINYTNVCMSGCKFCAFFRAPGDEGGYVLSKDVLADKVRETVELGGYQILLQGGMNPDLDLAFYEDMLSFLKEKFPSVAIHGFSPSEIWYWGQESGLGHVEVMRRLVAAGLDSIPGGGAEILVDRVRSDVSPRKATADQWLEVMRDAHGLGLRTTATMMLGEGETLEERIEHLDRIRSLQDETGGFTAFIPWTFQPEHTRLPRPEASSETYLKTLALSRLYLDNIDNVQASWVTQGPLIGQLALFWGANDFGSTMIEENVVAAAGVHFRLPESKLRSLVESAGFVPCRRRMDYTLME